MDFQIAKLENEIRKNVKLENANLGKCKIEIWINGNLEKWKHEKMEKGKMEIQKNGNMEKLEIKSSR